MTTEFINNLERLGKMYQNNLLTKEEYSKCKSLVISTFEQPSNSTSEQPQDPETNSSYRGAASPVTESSMEDEELNSKIMSALSDLGDGPSGADIYKAIHEANQVHSQIVKGTAANIDNGEMRELLMQQRKLTERRSITPPK
eukprot:TRINITY_DN7531_c1_g3_i1.p1 TRINITY_DN7531_c1_g3~~TRINITY_DN7531_c1_g3_i1.p1  ORF type:complete len:142 (+),score=32.27 TRINITY_DN7531_c1_g3_i1:55-480(+)